MRHTGRCLCGEVRYAIEGGIGPLLNCHCRFWRRAHGAAFATVALVPRAGFQWKAGAAKVRTHRNPAGARLRHGMAEPVRPVLGSGTTTVSMVVEIGTSVAGRS